MDIIVPFLRDIHANDSREWYLANTDYYFKAFDRNAQYIQKLVGLIGKFDSTIAPLKLYQCSFALIRDQRIKIDQRNYNDFLSGSFTRGGKYSGYASYYYQISPEPSSSGGSFLAVGLYRPNKELLDCFRNTILEMGLEKFDEAYKAGTIDRIFTTNLVYGTPELKQRPWYTEVNMCKYVAYLIDTLNNDATISTLLNPVQRIQTLMDKHRKALAKQIKINFEEDN